MALTSSTRTQEWHGAATRACRAPCHTPFVCEAQVLPKTSQKGVEYVHFNVQFSFIVAFLWLNAIYGGLSWRGRSNISVL